MGNCPFRLFSPHYVVKETGAAVHEPRLRAPCTVTSRNLLLCVCASGELNVVCKDTNRVRLILGVTRLLGAAIILGGVRGFSCRLVPTLGDIKMLSESGSDSPPNFARPNAEGFIFLGFCLLLTFT